MINKTAIIIVSHNNKAITTKLCNQIQKYTKTEYDLLVVETGSKPNEIVTDYPALIAPDGIRMTNGFNLGIFYMKQREKIFNIHYNNFWICVNDTLHYDIDTLSPMVKFMNNNSDCGEIHPFIENSPSPYLHKKLDGKKARAESFCEIVCPLLSRKAIDLDLLDSRFYYGWGIDYSLTKTLYDNNLKIYVSNEVGVKHDAGTTTKTGKDSSFKTLANQFDVSRENMLKGLIEKYGEKWYKVIYDSIPNAVSKDSYAYWLCDVGCNAKKEDLI